MNFRLHSSFLRWFIVALIALLTCAAAMAADNGAMNDIRFKDYEGFQKRWQLVTVRFRSDTDEQRFIYANPIAYKALLKETKDYPDGAVFAKIGAMTVEDFEFPSSKVPAGALRVQFMVRDRKKYASTSGWGYALFTASGAVSSSENQETQALACDACHQLVKESRGEVFAQPVQLVSGMPGQMLASPRVFFSDKKPSELPPGLRQVLPPQTAKVRFVEGRLRDHLFSGTLNEIQPLLIKEALLANDPALLLGADQKQFVLVYPQKENTGGCHRDEKTVTIHSAFFQVAAQPATDPSAMGALPDLRQQDIFLCAAP